MVLLITKRLWRWNHLENPKAQINTTGFPNDNLMKDLALFYVKREQYQNDLDKYNQNRAERIEQIRIAQARETTTIRRKTTNSKRSRTEITNEFTIYRKM